MFVINPLSHKSKDKIQQRIDNKTKPIGSLGVLEDIALQLSLILGDEEPKLLQPTQLVFAGDHGVSELGVSIAGNEVTGQMVANFCAGGAAINAFCDQSQMELKVIDCGTVSEQPDHPRLIKQRIAPMTAPFHLQAAMSVKQAEQAITLGAKIAAKQIDAGSNIIGIGEMGIANTTSAAALMHAITDNDIDYCVGRGTGIDDFRLAKKKEIIKTAVLLHRDRMSTPLETLAAVGGFEIAQMVGAMLAVAKAEKVIIVDGFISTTAALIATKLSPNVRDYMIFSHCSKELGHHLLLKELHASPVLSLDLRLGEGTGCPLVLPLLQNALAFYNQMASFSQANVTEVN
ncbi:nicotinate-nucleotide--dimethylbenzimidazole phosphoribosyltransferase [Psychrobium sp. 1_MG-2023]|uniref:nicotinate-nucleotide--dimethylbenzimidazole phosphoribosyltransferase n=1 Tax=Psychrobium sp. 1_MG-2023 TaxID=3062624 RepID=UPI000C34E9C5|nr:nicotinate-nucleotide--dimethylbenzimidazole phosphoribosyltransferase [Psychrobium sp. 1_MG-2023]MDP2559711.1 nicotinate-nucleotide--dimethylbenzimidazole phosphoribosyltransferase [Psychrobium sp. 1_MG-2023]PKF59540.1 nicotinate-nucleotide--dimethylbenzimidazole phosphoribosyltransferase [Alteromonadales bacterium alter-6D02]